ncbi:lipocalin family protein [Uliginosibacterium sp. 31-16]|uniref:lipocalin family protein n=1 Tax=Uliginosibacterium sp. 31-16 TaxID=3068315 RepID=UPI00273E719E|nr:lipocalin family protein [Uliginosibacterium sp. 31-16]MDP5239741.1 lipocalin family protein [Uliginosibacterium sp. 31-16]
MKIRLILSALIFGTLNLCSFSTFASAPTTEEPLIPIATLDVPRYLGTWYEIAKFPNWFQRKCASDTRADYSLKPDGTLQVLNRCRQIDGEITEALGAARQIGDASSPKLKVRFAPAWLSFIPAVWGNYWVIDLDADYQLAAVSEPGREYLWILSRSPQPAPQAYAALLERLKNKGFDIRKLEITPHTP